LWMFFTVTNIASILSFLFCIYVYRCYYKKFLILFFNIRNICWILVWRNFERILGSYQSITSLIFLYQRIAILIIAFIISIEVKKFCLRGQNWSNLWIYTLQKSRWN
jgi:hypothetical protein